MPLSRGQCLVLVALVLFSLWGGSAQAATQTGHLVLLTPTVPQPVTISVEAGAVVIWLNRTPDRPLSLTFEDTQSPDASCSASAGFVREGDRLYTLPALPPGGTASLCFPSAGSYSYKVHGLDRPTPGTVTVGGSP